MTIDGAMSAAASRTDNTFFIAYFFLRLTANAAAAEDIAVNIAAVGGTAPVFGEDVLLLFPDLSLLSEDDELFREVFCPPPLMTVLSPPLLALLLWDDIPFLGE